MGRRMVEAALTAATVAGVLVASAGTAAAESFDLTEEWGTASVTVGKHWTGGATVTVEITDTKSDSRCVYVRYRVNAPRWYDGWDKAKRVCGNGDTDSGDSEWVPIGTAGPVESVEIGLCREQGFGRDLCSPTTTVTL